MKFMIVAFMACACASAALASSLYSTGGYSGYNAAPQSLVKATWDEWSADGYGPHRPVALQPLATLRSVSIVPTGRRIGASYGRGQNIGHIIGGGHPYSIGGRHPINSETLRLAHLVLRLPSAGGPIRQIPSRGYAAY